MPGLPLAETDDIRLAQELAVRGVPARRAILDAAVERIKNPDRKARFAFVRPALSRGPGRARAFFATLEDVGEPPARAVGARGARATCTIRCAPHAPKKFLRPSLELLREIQRTGDIFFPKRWTDATLGGHQSPDAAAVVTNSWRAAADYPERLRLVILSSADDLFRGGADKR